MCGIYGYFHRHKQQLAPAILEKMGASIFHRGPDDGGLFVGDGVALGNRRLSIIDIEGGKQPFYSEDGNIVVVQNGEIYNYLELADELKSEGVFCQTNSDTEVILRLYERHGMSFISKLNGMFSISIYDKRQDALYLIRDRLGVKPLYYYDDGDLFVFASEIKSILKADVPRQVDVQALNSYLTFNYVLPPSTLFQGIYHVLPGSYVKITTNGMENKTWWDLSSFETDCLKSEQQWITEFNDILLDSVKLRLRADVPCGAFLSGGVDSSTIVGLIDRLGKKIKSFCIGFSEPRFDESKYAEFAAKKFNTQHYLEVAKQDMLELWPMVTYFCDQPHGDVSFMPTYVVSKLASKHLKVVLTGDGGDELFAGYDKYKDFFDANDVDLYTNSEFYHNYFSGIGLFSAETKAKLLKNYDHENDLSYGLYESEMKKVAHMDRINQALYFDCKCLLPGNNLVKPDRMGMAASIEARTPFLDYRMVELAFAMPGGYKLHNGETKYIYKKAVRELIGDELLNRKKQMFTVPIGEWLKTECAEKYRQLVVESGSISEEFFNIPYVCQMFDEHRSGAANFTRELRAILSFEIWGRIFIKNNYDGIIGEINA
jgi:asparagine synthase (glutamine-hydrolysing)